MKQLSEDIQVLEKNIEKSIRIFGGIREEIHSIYTRKEQCRIGEYIQYHILLFLKGDRKILDKIFNLNTKLDIQESALLILFIQSTILEQNNENKLNDEFQLVFSTYCAPLNTIQDVIHTVISKIESSLQSIFYEHYKLNEYNECYKQSWLQIYFYDVNWYQEYIFLILEPQDEYINISIDCIENYAFNFSYYMSNQINKTLNIYKEQIIKTKQIFQYHNIVLISIITSIFNTKIQPFLTQVQNFLWKQDKNRYLKVQTLAALQLRSFAAQIFEICKISKVSTNEIIKNTNDDIINISGQWDAQYTDDREFINLTAIDGDKLQINIKNIINTNTNSTNDNNNNIQKYIQNQLRYLQKYRGNIQKPKNIINRDITIEWQQDEINSVLYTYTSTWLDREQEELYTIEMNIMEEQYITRKEYEIKNNNIKSILFTSKLNINTISIDKNKILPWQQNSLQSEGIRSQWKNIHIILKRSEMQQPQSQKPETLITIYCNQQEFFYGKYLKYIQENSMNIISNTNNHDFFIIIKECSDIEQRLRNFYDHWIYPFIYEQENYRFIIENTKKIQKEEIQYLQNQGIQNSITQIFIYIEKLLYNQSKDVYNIIDSNYLYDNDNTTTFDTICNEQLHLFGSAQMSMENTNLERFYNFIGIKIINILINYLKRFVYKITINGAALLQQDQRKVQHILNDIPNTTVHNSMSDLCLLCTIFFIDAKGQPNLLLENSEYIRIMDLQYFETFLTLRSDWPQCGEMISKRLSLYLKKTNTTNTIGLTGSNVISKT